MRASALMRVVRRSFRDERGESTVLSHALLSLLAVVMIGATARGQVTAASAIGTFMGTEAMNIARSGAGAGGGAGFMGMLGGMAGGMLGGLIGSTLGQAISQDWASRVD